MEPGIITALIAAGSALTGAFGGAGLNAWIGRQAEDRRLMAEDSRRWLADMRRIYGHFLTLTSSMLSQMNSTASCLPRTEDEKVPDWQARIAAEDGAKYMTQWDEDVQPLLWELELMSSDSVGNLANTVTDKLLDAMGVIQSAGTSGDYFEASADASRSIDAMRNAMRQELNRPFTDEHG